MRNQHERSHPSLPKHTDLHAIYNPAPVASRIKKSPPKSTLLISRLPDQEHFSRQHPVVKLQLKSLAPPSFPSSHPHLTGSIASNKRVRQRLGSLHSTTVPYQQGLATANTQEGWLAEIETRLEHRIRCGQEQTIHLEQEHKIEEHDYTLYLYFVTKYGPLDGILYCSSRFPGQLYAKRVDKNARTLQHWFRQRMRAVRRYWITRLAREVTASSLQTGQTLAICLLANENHAISFLKQIQWRHARNGFHAWVSYTKRQQQVYQKWMHARAQERNRRFYQWKDRIQVIREFKHDLKRVAKKKQLNYSFVLWQRWQQRHEKLRLHLMKQWNELQRRVFLEWRRLVIQQKRKYISVVVIQRIWRGYRVLHWYKRQLLASKAINRVGRGYLARKQVACRREQWMFIELMEQLKNVLVFEEFSTKMAIPYRSQALQLYGARQRHIVEALAHAEAHAQVLVQNDLDKVVRNQRHYQLQERIKMLQEQRINLSYDTIEARARAMLIEEEIQAARTNVLIKCAASEPASIPHPLQNGAFLCVVCAADRVLWLDSVAEMGLTETSLARTPFCCCTPQHHEWLVHDVWLLLADLEAQDHLIASTLLNDKIPFRQCSPFLPLIPIARSTKPMLESIQPVVPILFRREPNITLPESIPCLPFASTELIVPPLVIIPNAQSLPAPESVRREPTTSSREPPIPCLPFVSPEVVDTPLVIVSSTQSSKTLEPVTDIQPQESLPCLPDVVVSPLVIAKNPPSTPQLLSSRDTKTEIIQDLISTTTIEDEATIKSFNRRDHEAVGDVHPDVLQVINELIELVELIHQTEEEEEARLEYQETAPYARNHRPESAKVRVLSAIVRIQSVFRGFITRRAFRMALYQQALACGMLGAMPGTFQGQSGWYQDPQTLLVYYFEVKENEWNAQIVLECDTLILTSYQMDQMLLNVAEQEEQP